MATREQIIAALLAALAASAPSGTPYVTTGRVPRDPDDVKGNECPMLMLIDHREGYVRPSPSLPPIRHLEEIALIYVDALGNENLIPSALMNPYLDGIDAALKPDNLGNGKFTLGGLVDNVMIEGEVIKAYSGTTGKGLAVIPIKIRLP